MKRYLNSVLLAGWLGGSLTLGAAQASAHDGGAWSPAVLAGASYVILPPRIEGNSKVLNAQQRQVILKSMRQDLAQAIKRRYPRATVVAEAGSGEAVKVTPVVEAPRALLPWTKLMVRLVFELRNGEHVVLKNQFNLLTLWRQQDNAARYVYDKMVKDLP